MVPRRALLAAPLAAPLLVAQAPPRPMRLIAGFPPGGTIDVVSRLLAERLRGHWAANVIVENRPGAAGRLALEQLKAADPDGTTAVISPAGMITIFPHLYPRTLRYDPFTDFAAVTPVCTYPFAFACGPAVPATTLADALGWMKANPGAAIGNPAAGSAPHFLAVQLARHAGLTATQAPYRGSAPAIQDMLSHSLPLVMTVLGELVPHHRNGRLRILAVTSAQRLPRLPEVPTFAEAGMAELAGEEWFGAFLPARTPAPVVAAFNAALGQAVAAPETQAAFARLEFAAAHQTPDAFAARIRAEHAGWQPIIASSGFRAEE